VKKPLTGTNPDDRRPHNKTDQKCASRIEASHHRVEPANTATFLKPNRQNAKHPPTSAATDLRRGELREPECSTKSTIESPRTNRMARGTTAILAMVRALPEADSGKPLGNSD